MDHEAIAALVRILTHSSVLGPTPAMVLENWKSDEIMQVEDLLLTQWRKMEDVVRINPDESISASRLEEAARNSPRFKVRRDETGAEEVRLVFKKEMEMKKKKSEAEADPEK